jgi:hypothetical protein
MANIYEYDYGLPLPWAKTIVITPIPPNPSGESSGVDFSFFAIDVLFYAFVAYALFALGMRIYANLRRENAHPRM